MLDNGRKARAAWNETVPANMCHYEEARRRLVEGERLVAGWGELIARMQADGHDVTVARSLLKSFEHELEDRMRKLARFGSPVPGRRSVDPRVMPPTTPTGARLSSPVVFAVEILSWATIGFSILRSLSRYLGTGQRGTVPGPLRGRAVQPEGSQERRRLGAVEQSRRG